MSLWLVFFSSSARAAPPAEPTYWQDIRPLLRKHCTVCHNTRNLKEIDVSGGLALDSYAAILKGSKGPVLEAGKGARSLLVQLLATSDDGKRMPRGASPLGPESIDLIRRWIDVGAKEGNRPNDNDAPSVTSVLRRRRKLEVVLPTNAVPPKGLFGPGNPQKLALSLKVGPLSPVAAVAFSPDGKLLAAGSYGRVSVWDLGSARPVKVLTNVLGTVNDIRFSPDGGVLAVAGGQPSAKGDLRLYRVADWKLLGTLGGHQDVVFSVAFDPDGKHLASASFDKTVRLWNVATHQPEKVFSGHSDFVYSVAFSPDDKWLASASKDRTVRIVDAGSGKSLFTFSGMEQDVLAVAVSPDGRNIVSSGYDSGLHWWEAQTGKRLRVQNGHGLAVHEICFSKDGTLLASAGADKTVRLWEGRTGAPVRTLSVDSIVYAVAVSPGGKLLASGSFDGLVRLWDTASGRQLATLLTLPPEGDHLDWLAATPEGYTAVSPALKASGQWTMAGQPVPEDPIWEVLGQADLVAKAVCGQALTAPTFGGAKK